MFSRLLSLKIYKSLLFVVEVSTFLAEGEGEDIGL
jgi:hypothetical protein